MADIFEKIKQSNQQKTEQVQKLSDDELRKIIAEPNKYPLDVLVLAQAEWEARFPTPPAAQPEPKSPIPVINTQSGCFRGCLFILVIWLVPYLLNACWLIGGNVINQVKWQRRGSTSYQATVGMSGLVPLSGSSQIVVRQGEIIRAVHYRFEPNEHIDLFKEVTIETMFGEAYTCSLFFPLLTCSIEYHPYYGYPTEVEVRCPIPDACFTDKYVKSLVLINP